MANQFVNLPVPVGNGVGAAVDVSTFGALKTMLCGGNATAQVTVEFNNAAVATDGSWQALTTFQNTGQLTVRVAARWMRVRVSNYNSYVGGQAVVDVGGTDDGSQFATLVAPVGNGVGAAVNVSALGLFKTVQVGGDFRGTTIIEVSEDGNEWAQPFSFTAQGGAQSAVIAAEFMRVRRVGVPQVAPGLPIVNVGATDDFSGDDGVAISAGSQSVATGTVLFADSNGISFGMSASSRVTASMDAFRSVVGPGSTATGPTLSLANSNGVTFGISGQTVTASINAGGVPFGISAGTQSVSTGTVAFSNANNVTFGMAGSATVTASASFPAETPFALSAGTQSVSTGTVSFANSNGVSFGMSGSNSITAAIDAIKSISAGTTFATGPNVSFANGSGVTFGVNGNTVTASVAAAAADITLSHFSPGLYASKQFVNIQQGSLQIQAMTLPHPLSFSQLALGQFFSANAASTATVSLSQQFGIYTLNVSTLSLLMSTSMSISINHSTNLSVSLNDGFRLMTTGWSQSLSKGEYFVGQIWSTTTSSQNATLQQAVWLGAFSTNLFAGYQGVASTNGGTYAAQFGFGVFKTATGALPNSVALSDLNGQNSNVYNAPFFQLAVTA